MSKPIIIAVDDQSIICNLIVSMLKDTYDIVTFNDGKAAVEYLSENQADLVLLDYEMPGMTGYEVLMAIRSHKKTAAVPVIFLTGATSARMEQEMRERGANDYICKPIDFNVLRQHIKKHLAAENK